MKKDHLENTEETQYSADNAAENMTNQQIEEDNQGQETSKADNTTEELAQLKDSYLRLMAEYDNYRKRTVKEKAELIKNGGEKVLIGLLPVIDDFERALQNINPDSTSEGISEGINLIYNKFMSFLKQNGVQPMNAIGEEFNDELFDAIATVPSQDESSKGKVIDCVQKGYTLNDKVIRHAKVVVAG